MRAARLLDTASLEAVLAGLSWQGLMTASAWRGPRPHHSVLGLWLRRGSTTFGATPGRRPAETIQFVGAARRGNAAIGGGDHKRTTRGNERCGGAHQPADAAACAAPT